MAFPQTPSHALPGAFLHTPAIASRLAQQQDPVRRQLFRENSTSGVQVTRFGQDGLDAPTQPAEEQALQNLPPQNLPPQPPLAKAATYVNNALTRDGEYPQLDSYCRRKSFLLLYSTFLFYTDTKLTLTMHRALVRLRCYGHRIAMGSLQDDAHVSHPSECDGAV